MADKFWQYLSRAEGGLGAENPIEANKRIKAQDYADPDDIQASDAVQPAKEQEGPKNQVHFSGNSTHAVSS